MSETIVNIFNTPHYFTIKQSDSIEQESKKIIELVDDGDLEYPWAGHSSVQQVYYQSTKTPIAEFNAYNPADAEDEFDGAFEIVKTLCMSNREIIISAEDYPDSPQAFINATLGSIWLNGEEEIQYKVEIDGEVIDDGRLFGDNTPFSMADYIPDTGFSALTFEYRPFEGTWYLINLSAL